MNNLLSYFGLVELLTTIYLYQQPTKLWADEAPPSLKNLVTPLYGTGKSLSEALIFASTNPQYDNRLFIELQVQYMKIPSLNLGRTCCLQKLFLTFRTIFVHNMISPCSAKRRASDKYLPVCECFLICMISINIQNDYILSQAIIV